MLELRDVTHIYPNGTKALDNVTLSKIGRASCRERV